MFVNIGQWSVQVSNVFIVPTCFDLTNLKGEKRRNVGKLNNELNIVNQPCRSTLPEIERTALRILGK